MELCSKCQINKITYTTKQLCRKCYDRDRKSNPNYKEYQKKYRDTPKRQKYLEEYELKPGRKERQKDNSLQRRYGISLETYNSLLASQNGKCACCDIAVDLKVDHCHISGKVRGLLCHACNVSIGFAREDKKILQNLIDYLEKYK